MASSLATFGTLATLVSLACARPDPVPGAGLTTLDESKLVDLSWAFDEATVYWPNAKGFVHRKDVWAETESGSWYAAGGFSSDEHGGTHLDSPIHFARDGRTVDAIPLAQLVGPALVVDVPATVAGDTDHAISAAELEAWEREHGRIEPGSIVLFRTGWSRFWPDRRRYLGSDVPGDVAHLHFPGLARDAAALLVARRVDGVGIDTASLDPGPSRDFIAHQVLNAAGIYGLENVARLDALPARGTTLIALPMKIAEGSGAPVRILAILP